MKEEPHLGGSLSLASCEEKHTIFVCSFLRRSCSIQVIHEEEEEEEEEEEDVALRLS